jgi:hypothetical protein
VPLWGEIPISPIGYTKRALSLFRLVLASFGLFRASMRSKLWTMGADWDILKQAKAHAKAMKELRLSIAKTLSDAKGLNKVSQHNSRVIKDLNEPSKPAKIKRLKSKGST